MFDQSELNSLYRYCVTLNNDPDQAYDLLYSSVEKFYRSPPNEPKAKFSYIRRIIKNLWIDNYRRYTPIFESITPENQEKVAYLVTELPDLNLLEKELVNKNDLEIVWDKMSVEEREIFFLWIIEGLSLEEIATHLEMPKNTIISKIYRLRKRLKTTNHISKIA